jgi:hypothetical protein
MVLVNFVFGDPVVYLGLRSFSHNMRLYIYMKFPDFQEVLL